MATKKKKSAPVKRRRSPVKAKGKRRSTRRGVVQAGFGGAAMTILAGVAGAVLATKVAPMLGKQVENKKLLYGILAAGGAFLTVKASGPLKAVGIGMGIASGTMLLNEVAPDLLATGATVGRLAPGTVYRMQAAADRMRQGINGYRQRTVVGTGTGPDFPQPVRGPRNRTVVGPGASGGDLSY